MNIPAGKRGDRYILTIEVAASDADNDTHCPDNRRARVTLRAPEARLVQKIRLRCSVASSSADCLNPFAPKVRTGTRFFLRSAKDQVKIRNKARVPYSIRDATNWDLLYRTSLLDQRRRHVHELGAGKLISITVPGHNNALEIDGVMPYASGSREAWFDPE